jgi:uncharacterized protein (UPF0335 family)
MLLKKISALLFFAITSYLTITAQQKEYYTDYWKKVEAVEKKGLTKSASSEVSTIYQMAKKSGNDAQQIKACIYLIHYRNMVEEDSPENNIFYVDTLIMEAKAPAKNILQSMQAEMFFRYLQNNRWKLYNRTKLAEEKSKDITTWGLDKLHSTIAGLYKSSLSNQHILKSSSLEGYAPIIVNGKNTRQLRPTLFDFLAFRALDYFVNDERDLIKPAYQFTINDSRAFAPAAEFVNTSFKTKDTASLHHAAILLLQDILKFHLSDTSPDALLDADFFRLNFINQYAANEDKTKRYEAALKNIEEKYASNPAAAQAMYLRAQIYQTKGNDFDPLSNTENQYELKRAKALCEEAMAKFPESEGGINCHNLLNQLLQPSLSMQAEKVNRYVSKQDQRTATLYKNNTKL